MIRRSPGATGSRAEWIAALHLQSLGLQIIAQNFRTKAGEIDLIARHDDTVVFVEVRYRRAAEYGLPVETISATKRRRIVRAAAHYLTTLVTIPNCRFDVITLIGDTPTSEACEWIQGAFDTSDSLWRG